MMLQFCTIVLGVAILGGAIGMINRGIAGVERSVSYGAADVWVGIVFGGMAAYVIWGTL